MYSQIISTARAEFVWDDSLAIAAVLLVLSSYKKNPIKL